MIQNWRNIKFINCELIKLKILGLQVRPTSIKVVILMRLLITKTAREAS